MAFAVPVNDAYRYLDAFDDNTGIDLNTTGFINLAGVQTAKSKSNQLISQCFHLPTPAGASFTGWSFAEFTIGNLDQVRTNNLSIESCDGSTSFMTVSPQTGSNAYDLSAVVPQTTTHLRFRWALVYQGGGGARTASITSWRALGTASGASVLNITPSNTSSSSNADISFTLGLSSTGATTRNPVLEVDLTVINGTPDTGPSGIGLATDATVCYDTDNNGTAGIPVSECKRYRPIEFLSASNGTSGEPANLSDLSQPSQTPATNGSTDGTIQWQLQDLPDAYSGSISVNLHIPKGYIDGKTMALSATLNHGETSTNGTLNNFQTITSSSPVINISSEHNSRITAWSPFGNLAPGSQNISDNYYIRNNANQSGSPSDHEHVTVTLNSPASSTCVPDYRSTIVRSKYNWPSHTVAPAVGSPLDSNPVTVIFHRLSHINDSSNARASLRYDIPVNCSAGTVARTQASIDTASPPVNNNPIRSHNIEFNACRGGYNHMHRLQSGLLVENNYLPNPGWNEYYINRGSIRPGEYFSTWSPYGDSTYRTQTIVLDKSYAVIDIPDAATFHGYRTRSREDTDSSIYFFKDPDGSAPNPDDATFNNNFDPTVESPASGWYPVQRNWTGPFTNYTGGTGDASNPTAVVGPNARLLAVKTNDNTSVGATDYGLFRAQAVWRVCDGSYGCAQSPENTAVKVTGNTYTYQQTQAPFARSCSTMNGYTAYVRSVSYPKAYTTAVQQNVPAGGVASIVLSPHNSNFASQFVDGHWSFDLSAIASSIDLDNVTGEVITTGLNLPKANQNVQGQVCDVNDIVFVAPTAANPIAYWNIPDRCQIPNGWGYRIANNTSQDNIVPAYQLKLNAPIKTTTLANTVLNFPGQIRRKDLSAAGAENAVTTTRWAASNYQSIAAITVQENPSVNGSKSAPSGWPINSTFSYNMAIENQGNTSLAGYFLLDELPRAGTNGSEFDPVYGSVFVNASASDISIERSEDSQCSVDHLNAVWLTESLSPTSRAGFQVQTAALPPTTLCIRFRRSPSGPWLLPQQNIYLAVDMTIPDDVFLSGKNIYNKAALGVTDVFGGTSNITTTETALVTTTVDGAVVLGASKSTSATIDKPGQIAWLLGYHNASGTDALAVTVSDTLPADTTYQGLVQALPSGVTCKNGSAGDINNDGIDDCAIINTAPAGSGGTLEFEIALLTPSDGNPGAGTDEGQIGVWTTLQTTGVTQNCVYAIPSGGVTGSGCADGQLSSLNFSKSQWVDTGRTGTIPKVYFGETIKYTLTAENTGATAKYVRLEDQLPAEVSFLPGSLLIDGASASDGLISGGKLSYISILPLAPGAQTIVEISAQLISGTASSLVSNQANSMLCGSRTDVNTCTGALASNQVQAEIEGARIDGLIFNDNGSGNAVAHNGTMEGTEKPLENIQVSLFDTTANQLLETTNTDASGNFSFFTNTMPGNNYQIRAILSTHWVPVSHQKGNTMATESSASTSTLSFQAQAASTAYSNIRFGLVQRPELIADQIATTQPAASVLLAHTLKITSPGSVAFDLTDAQAVSNLDGWQVDLFHDQDCNQQLANTEPQINSAISIDPDINSELCVILQVHAPSQLAQTLTLAVPLIATINLQDSAGTGHAVSITTNVIDTLEIVLISDGQLVLNKQVSNITRNRPMTSANQATPGEILRYQINFEAAGTGDLTEVFINDSTPAYTSLSQPVICPTGLTNCIVIIPASSINNTGYSGQIRWKIADTLPAGSNGVVSYDVTVE